MPSPRSAQPVHAPGTVLGDYRIGAPIGRGGYARVYRATQLSTGRDVALKVLFADQGEERFAREAAILSALSHRNIVEVVGYGVDGGAPYLALELLEGDTLMDRLRHGVPVPPEQAAWILGETLAGLAAAHDAGVIHRDVKPSNILLTNDGGRLAVKLIDFGVSRLVGATKLTETGALVGTPAYASPELVGAEPYDHRTDLWSVGVVLYEAVTGERPFEGTLVELIAQILGPPPSLASVPENLRDVLATALVPASARASSAAELRARLYAAVDPRPPGAARDPRTLAGDTTVFAPASRSPAPPTLPRHANLVASAPAPTSMPAPGSAPAPSTAPGHAGRAPSVPPDRRTWIAAVAAAATVLSLGLCSFGGAFLLWPSSPSPRAAPPGTNDGPGPLMLPPVVEPEVVCPRAYECCMNVVETGEGLDHEENELRCRGRTQLSEGSCAAAEEQWCTLPNANGACRDYYDCCVRLDELSGGRGGICDFIADLETTDCVAVMRADYGDSCRAQFGIGGDPPAE